MKILTPISLGELYDKISILEIKKDRIKDEEKLKNIDFELSELLSIAKNYPIESDLYIKLKRVNLSLWDIEDNIRIKEKNKKFDEWFINLARSVYFTNDERSDIKKEINQLYGSQIVEEKSYEKYN
jgi:hypothetical protein